MSNASKAARRAAIARATAVVNDGSAWTRRSATTTKGDGVESLSMRAARHFGLHTEPRTTIVLGQGKAVVVAERMGRKVLATYEEQNYGIEASYSLLTDRQRESLIAALNHPPERRTDG